MKTHVMNTYQRLPVTFSHGEGVWLIDTDGKRYLDALCGISVTNLGHAHPAVSAAIKKQADLLLHTSNLYHITPQQQLAEKLCSISGMDNVFFSNSGAEANEAAIKLARLHASHKGNSHPIIVTMTGSFHGRTLATITATANDKIKAGFGPLPPGFVYGEYNNIDSAKQLFAEHGDNIAAVFVEPVQGEGGINVGDADYLLQLQQLCHDHQALFMVDEVQSGNGRCGHYFAFQGLGLSPDVVTTAKGLGNGIPIGACLAKGAAAETLSPGTHGSTFGGNPLATAAALAVIDTIEKNQLCKRAAELGSSIRADFKKALANNAAVIDIRGSGLMIGIELNRPCGQLVSDALTAGLLINVTAGSTIRLLPPLTMTDENAATLVETLTTLIEQFTASA
ncbi:MAG: aspartate aminotransferase family protein [Cellvibrionales bacterium]|jgi:acetylornithine/N-succinyldiaminopimelate aminotransferase|nr:aspartate aminotransferase family protein [Cellvibrionales bacterium]